MFQWDKSIRNLGVPADKVVQLFRSMRDVQLALPGLPAQEGSAYLCQYQSGQKIVTMVIFHLLKNGQLAFYVGTPREVAADKAAGMLDQALMFIESMGFLMTNFDIDLLGEADREMLWCSLPLHKGMPAAGEGGPPVPAREGVELPAAADKPGAKSPQASAVPAQPAETEEVALSGAEGPSPRPGAFDLPPAGGPATADQCSVDDLLAAVEALRTRRPEPRSRKKPPSAEELQRRRRELTANLGRILASL